MAPPGRRRRCAALLLALAALAACAGAARPARELEGARLDGSAGAGPPSAWRPTRYGQGRGGAGGGRAAGDRRPPPARSLLQQAAPGLDGLLGRALAAAARLAGPWGDASPGDPTAGDAVLQALGPMLLDPFSTPTLDADAGGGGSGGNGRGGGGGGSGRSGGGGRRSGGDSSGGGEGSVRFYNPPGGRGSASLALSVAFAPLGAGGGEALRLPLPPRSFYVDVKDESVKYGGRCDGGSGLVYRDQVVLCGGLREGVAYTVSLFDTPGARRAREGAGGAGRSSGGAAPRPPAGRTTRARRAAHAGTERDGAAALPLASGSFVLRGGGTIEAALRVELGLLELEASFGSLAWAGSRYPQRRGSAPVQMHAQIVGAQIVVWTKSSPGLIWDMQWTGDAGLAPFFVVPGSFEFVANMSVGDTQLASLPVAFDPADPGLLARGAAAAPQTRQLVAAPQLLCTGEVEDVRGEGGAFPSNLSALEPDRRAIYHPRGFFCRWELQPDYPEVTLTVSYAGLLPDEALTLHLGPNNVVQLRRPASPGAGGVFSARLWVERSVFVEFETTRTSTAAVGDFSVAWTSAGPAPRGPPRARVMVVALSCVSAAAAALAALCLFCVCCARRRRGVVLVAEGGSGGAAQGAAIPRVPSGVRALLPSKPYQPPPADNPLPGAATEADCCAICLVELEPGESVTVLPCMHFYHRECIDSWLSRNCTCPLCKANVLRAFAGGAQGAGQQPASRRRRRSQRRAVAHAPGSGGGGGGGEQGADAGSSSGSSSGSGAGHTSSSSERSSSSQPGTPGAAAALGGAAAGVWAASEIELPAVSSLGGRSTSAALHGDAVAAVAQLPSPAAHQWQGRLPPLALPSGAAGAALSPKDGGGAAPVGGGGGAEQQGRMSRAPSLGALQAGTVHAVPADFAAAAAAAAAALAAAQQQPAVAAIAGADPGSAGPASPPAGPLGGALGAAQAGVSAIRDSGRELGRRLHGMLRASSGGGGGGIDGGGDAPAPAAGLAVGRTSPEPPQSSGRVAVSIYAYAGHPATDDDDELPASEGAPRASGGGDLRARA
ncbi:gol [Scenedesmus sp. PABB004]|nr:gol [Scenedesmus sp. PABB004]